MATAKKKQGAPKASASSRERPSSQSRADARAARKIAWRVGHRKVIDDIQAAKPSVPDRVVGIMGKSKPDVQVIRTGKIGRPPIAYTDELDEQLFELIVSGLSLEKISRLSNMPSVSVLLYWVGTKTHPFSATYARAKALLVPLYEERAIDLATERQEATIHVVRDGEDGSYIETRRVDAVERSKLGVSAYQWALGWMVPKKHGRNPDDGNKGPNEQLKSLFDNLMSGPVLKQKKQGVK